MMGQLTGSLSHELSQPLTGILSNAQAAEIMIRRGRYDSEEMASIMTDIASDAKRAAGLMRNLRDLYREQKGDYRLFDINGVVGDTIRLLHSEFIIQGVKVSTRCTVSCPAVDMTGKSCTSR